MAGTEGILYADSSEEVIHINYSNGKAPETVPCPQENSSGHGGSDKSFFDEFINCIKQNTRPQADYMAGLASTVIGNAIEKSRLTNLTVEISESEYQL